MVDFRLDRWRGNREFGTPLNCWRKVLSGVTEIAFVFRAVHIGSLDYSYRAVMADNRVGPAVLFRFRSRRY